MPWVGLQFVIVVFPDHTHLLNPQIAKHEVFYAVDGSAVCDCGIS